MKTVLPFGIPDIDSRLPGGGLTLGALHEIAGGGNGAVDGAAAALFAAGVSDLKVETATVQSLTPRRMRLPPAVMST